jgi:hypothetical protein
LARFNTDVVFVDGSGQVRAVHGDLTLRANEAGGGHVVVGSGISLRPENDCDASDAIDLGQVDHRWNTVFACSGNFLDRPTVNGSGVLLQGEATGSATSGSFCKTLTFSALDGIDFILNHGLQTENFTWSMWRTNTTPIRAVLPRNIIPVDANNVRVQLFRATTGKIVITSCGGIDTGGSSSGVKSLNGLTDHISILPSDGIDVSTVGNDILLAPLFTSTSGAIVQQKCEDIVTLSGIVDGISGGGIPSASGAIIKLNQGIAEYYLSVDSGSWSVSPTTVPLNTTVLEDTVYYSRSGGVITINVDGIYRISYGININQFTGNSRSMTAHQALLNGVTPISRSETWVYSRLNSQGEGSVYKSFFIQLDATDTIEIESIRDTGGGTFEHLANSNLSLEFMRFV